MENLIPALRAELDKLNTELEQHPLVQKVRQIERLLFLYEKSEAGPAAAATTLIKSEAIVATDRHNAPEMRSSQQRVVAPGSVRVNSKVAKIRRAISEYLSLMGPSRRTDILDHLKQEGLMGTEADPIRALASYLTGSKDLFKSVENGVWALVADTSSEDSQHKP